MFLSEIPVTVGAHSYVVRLAPQALTWIGVSLQQLSISPRVALVADATVAPLYAGRLGQSLQAAGFVSALYVVPAGETSKSLAQLASLLSFLAHHRVDRQGAVVALGGGVVGDLAGFAAASYLRGVRLIQAPTSLLAMVDSSVGGKTGINLPEGKNLAGAFHQPSLVVADLTTLATLPKREWAAGMAEVIKYGVIADASLFQTVATGRPENLAPIIRRCVEIKARIVAEDEHETTGRRAALNFGHTLGHALEQAAGYGTLLHGEAVAIGMRAAAHLSKKKCGLSGEEVTALEAALRANDLPLTAPALDRTAIRSALKLDKKAQSGINQWVLTPRLGQTILRSDVTLTDVEELLDLVLP